MENIQKKITRKLSKSIVAAKDDRTGSSMLSSSPERRPRDEVAKNVPRKDVENSNREEGKDKRQEVSKEKVAGKDKREVSKEKVTRFEESCIDGRCGQQLVDKVEPEQLKLRPRMAAVLPFSTGSISSTWGSIQGSNPESIDSIDILADDYNNYSEDIKNREPDRRDNQPETYKVESAQSVDSRESRRSSYDSLMSVSSQISMRSQKQRYDDVVEQEVLELPQVPVSNSNRSSQESQREPRPRSPLKAFPPAAPPQQPPFQRRNVKERERYQGQGRSVQSLPIEVPPDVTDDEEFYRYLNTRRNASLGERSFRPFTSNTDIRQQSPVQSPAGRERPSGSGFNSRFFRRSRSADTSPTPSYQYEPRSPPDEVESRVSRGPLTETCSSRAPFRESLSKLRTSSPASELNRRTLSLSCAIMTIALFSASAAQLRFLFVYSDAQQKPSFTAMSYFLVCTCLLIEILVGLGYLVLSRWTFATETIDRIYTCLIIGLVLVVFFNVIFAAFAIDDHYCEVLALKATSNALHKQAEVNHPSSEDHDVIYQ